MVCSECGCKCGTVFKDESFSHAFGNEPRHSEWSDCCDAEICDSVKQLCMENKEFIQMVRYLDGLRFEIGFDEMDDGLTIYIEKLNNDPVKFSVSADIKIEDGDPYIVDQNLNLIPANTVTVLSQLLKYMITE